MSRPPSSADSPAGSRGTIQRYIAPYGRRTRHRTQDRTAASCHRHGVARIARLRAAEIAPPARTVEHDGDPDAPPTASVSHLRCRVCQRGLDAPDIFWQGRRKTVVVRRIGRSAFRSRMRCLSHSRKHDEGPEHVTTGRAPRRHQGDRSGRLARGSPVHHLRTASPIRRDVW